MSTSAAAFGELKHKLDAAVVGDDVGSIVARVKQALQDALKSEGMSLPGDFRVTRPDTYARRLLHRDPDGRYTAVVMTWGPGQGTALHDHAGIWCVECVVEGEMEVRQYDLIEEKDGRFRFSPQSSVAAGRGSAGCLIPPFEYHTLRNRHENGASVTLHVYGGEMTHCHVFEPFEDGTYRRFEKQLYYHG